MSKSHINERIQQLKCFSVHSKLFQLNKILSKYTKIRKTSVTLNENFEKKLNNKRLVYYKQPTDSFSKKYKTRNYNPNLSLRILSVLLNTSSGVPSADMVISKPSFS